MNHRLRQFSQSVRWPASQ